MPNPIQNLFERLTERIFGVIGSHIGNTVSTYRAVCEAEQQSTLEDLACKYEAEGKSKLADRIRSQAAAITNVDPASDGASVLERLGCHQVTPKLPSVNSEEPAPQSLPRRKRRSRLTETKSVDDHSDTSSDGSV